MKKFGIPLILILVLVAGLAATSHALATPSEGFQEVNGEVFDDWGVCRTRAFGQDGFYQITETTFRPVIALESLGEGTAQAYSLGEQFIDEYPDRFQRAEEIFRFVRDKVQYASDIDWFSYDEFAQNADELVTSISQNGISQGDCEDSAVLLAVMYKGAGYRSAIIVGQGHTATLVYLPKYNKATMIFELEGEPGWVWAEATGKNNPLGWAPKEFIGVQLAAYEISAEEIAPIKPTTAPSAAFTDAGGGGSAPSPPIPFLSIIGIMLLISMFRRRRRA